jgi:glutamate dehydrogenase
MYAYEDLMAALEGEGLLDREIEFLPGSEEMAERRRAGRGLERPELAILVAYAKRWVARRLEGSDLIADPWFERDLRGYFPRKVVRRFGHLLADHALRPELICMVNSNLIVNALGPTFVSSLVAERGVEVAEVVRAYRIAREVTGAADRWQVVERLERLDRACQLELMAGIDGLVESVTRFYLTAEPHADIKEAIDAGQAGFERLADYIGELGSEERRRRREQVVERLVDKGVPEVLARAHALRPELVHAPGMVRVAAATGRSIEEVAQAFFAVGTELRLDWMESELERVPAPTRMQRWAVQAVREDAFALRRELARRALEEGGVETFLAQRSEQVNRLSGFLRSLAREGDPDLPGLTLAVRQLRAVL